MFKVWREMSMLAFEAQQAIWLRSMKMPPAVALHIVSQD